MLRDNLELIIGPINNAQFAEVMDLTTTDIKTNRVNFGKRTSINDVVEIAKISFNALSRGNDERGCNYRKTHMS